MAPPRKGIEHSGTVSGSGTSTPNQTIDFSPKIVNSLVIFADSGDLNVKLNSETNEHIIKSGTSMGFEGIKIATLTLVTGSIDYRYNGAYY